MLNMEEELKIEFLTSRGYVRKKCPVCGEYFWTLDPDRETCGESPCEPYSFIGRGLPRKMSVEEVREGFLSFFERNGHTRVGRYPIIARWRDDLFLVSASIVDFQPFVTAGLVPPPANPLTISQPCVRLKDIDKVGLTMGRHLTIFEMMAHHAFNRPGEEIYWKERTVELFHRYAAEVLGVKEEEITYKEGLWSGGGNAGPDLEPIVGGLEVATLVFMEYRVLPDGKLERMDTRIVDTGYGLERIAWLSQGTPTAFDAIYGGLVSRFMDALGVEPPDSPLLSEYSRISSLMSKIEAGESLLRLRAAAASRLGMDPSELDSLLRPVEAVYSVLDHTKAIAFLLGDGLVPSNSKEGYLGRLIIRRALRLLRGLAEVPLADLVAMQLDYWAPQFPELREARSRILEIVEIEEERYRETMERGVELVRREIKKLKKRGEKKFPLEVLIELYDSHGVPPEVAAEVAASQGFSAEVPDNFYELVAARHEAPEVRPPEVPEYLPQLEKLPKTELIFYEDPYARSFEARVVGVVGGAVVLDRTAFYPEGGGQPSDVGYLEFDGRRVRVTSVEKVSERVLHRVEGEPPAVGTRVRGVIDWDRRISLMRHHTAT
ncbi:MAG: alanine--tRNA ligase, partial [Thermoproteota archaeon]